MWGHPEFGDERVLFNFDEGGMARLARIEDDAVPAWSGLTPWFKDERRMRFSDPRTGRQYTADLRRENLGGTWRTMTTTGGWWCAVSDVDVVPETTEGRAAALPPVLPLVTATPRYPIEAIRQAKQGRVVTCFLVDVDGRDRRAGDHRAIGRGVSRADPHGLEAARAMRRAMRTVRCDRVAAATRSASTGSRSTRSSSTS